MHRNHTTVIPTALISNDTIERSRLQDLLKMTPFAPTEAVSVDAARWLHLSASRLGLVLIETKQTAICFLETISQMRTLFPEARIVVLADQFDIRFVTSAYAGGVHGFCLTTYPPDVLVKYLELALAGGFVIPAALVHAVVDMTPSRTGQVLDTDVLASSSANLETCRLSIRERQILDCLKVGAPNKVIARQFAIAEATIKVHVKAILRKIGVSNRTQAAMWACQHLPSGRGGSANV